LSLEQAGWRVALLPFPHAAGELTNRVYLSVSGVFCCFLPFSMVSCDQERQYELPIWKARTSSELTVCAEGKRTLTTFYSK